MCCVGLTITEMTKAGAEHVRIEKSAEGHTILDGAFFVSGEIPRETSYETVRRRYGTLLYSTKMLI